MDVLENPGLASIFKDSERLGEVQIDRQAVRFLDRDRSKRLVFSKRLYSDKLHSKLKTAHKKAFSAFNSRYSDEEVLRFVPVADKRVAAMMTTFERTAA